MDMGSTAVSAQGSKIEIQGSGVSTPKNISGLALGFPTIISSSAHGFQNGDIVTFAGLLGNTTLNGVTATVKNVTAGTYAVDVDTTGGTAYTSGGTATPNTWVKVKNAKAFKGFDGKPAKIDVTNLDSAMKESRPGLVDGGQFSVDVDIDVTDPGQQALRANFLTGAITNFRLTLPNGKTRTFPAYVESFPWDGGVDKVVTSTANLIITGLWTDA
ncbi:phage tail tube protein [Burkholderia vietnamiensis]|nr:phage tail tube protein [Burkholderia vietnamiensis]